MGTFLFVSWDGDRIGRVIGQARMSDDAEELRKVSSAIDRGNQLWKDWAVNHGGSVVSMGGDEGQVQVGASSLSDLSQIKAQYEEAINSTVSIGIGLKLSESFKALLCAKLRGRDKTVFYDKECGEEVKKASEAPEEDEKKKLSDEYLSKAQQITHTGEGGTQSDFHVQESSANPDIQSQQELRDFPHQEPTDYESEFRGLADDNEKKDQAKKASNSKEIEQIKQKVAQSLQAVHKQLPMLAQIKQASPETYSAVLGVVQGLIAIGRQLQNNDEQLAKSIGSSRRMWVGGGSRIPASGTPERKTWDNNYKQAVANHFSNGRAHLLKLVKVPIDKVDRSHSVFGNEAKTRLYHRMVMGGDELPPMVGSIKNGRLKIVDGNRRLDVALANKLTHVTAYVPMGKGEVDSSVPFEKADLMPGGLADALRPEDFDAEQLAIGSCRELEHTDDEDLAREIAMDHLSEDKDYYKEEVKDEEQKQEPMVKMALIHNDPEKPMTVYRVQNQYGEGPYNPSDKHDVPLGTGRHAPIPFKDFSPEDYGELHSQAIASQGTGSAFRFAFEKPEHALNWFGKDTLNRLKTRGFELTPVKASRVYRSNSGKQTMFLPHSSETKLQMAKSDWPMSEDKEELDPSKPVVNSKTLDKGAVPEHIKSIRAHRKLVPGQVLDSRRIVVKGPSGKNSIREVSSGMMRDLSDSVSNTIGPGAGQPTSARNRPSRD